MNDDGNADPFAGETSRLVQVLADLVKEKRVSVRSLEKAMGVGDSVFSKVLKGRITLNVRHVLMICTALGIEWRDFFTRAYGLSAGDAPPAAGPLPDDAQLEEKMIRILTRLGVLVPKMPDGSSAGER
jgi:transcriptional regulator with XRE-family HTH domain